MSYQIIVITTPYLHQYMSDVCGKYPEDITYQFVEYHTFSELKEIYETYEKHADGFLTTGIVVETVIERAIPGPLKPIMSLGSDQESIYKIALDLLINNRYLNPERVVYDVFVDVVPDPSIISLIESKSLVNTFPEFSDWLSHASLQELYDIERRTLSRIRTLWENGSIDIVICRYSSIVPQLKEMNIPCVFASSTDDCVHLTINHLLTQMKLRKISDHQPAVISVVCDKSTMQFWDKRQKSLLKKTLHGFAKKHDISFVFQEDKDQFLLLTDKAVLSHITGDFRYDLLSAELKSRLEFPILLSYGVGMTLRQAQKNARTALRESENSGGTFLMDENLRLNGPLDTKAAPIAINTITPRIQEIAECASLSTVTIQRIHRLTKLLGRKELTSKDLAEHFHVTMRNANRILQNLESNRLVQVIPPKTGHRGRPSKVYRIDWDID